MRSRSPLLPIFLIVLVDVLGLTIVLPLLGPYTETFGASAFVATLLSSSYAACSLISSPIIGQLSDRFGRKRLLLISQAGTFAGFVILASASSLWLIFVGRILDGITAGNLSVAQAYIADHTKPENRAKAFGIIGVAFGIGFLFGPLISGQLARFGLHAPFIMAACLSATSMLCTYTLLPREEPPREAAPDPSAASAPPPPAGRRISLFDTRAFADYLSRPGVAPLLLQFFLFQFSFSCFTQSFTLFAERRFVHDGHPWGPTEVGWIFGYSGLLGILLQGGLIGRLVKRFGEAPLAVAGFLSIAVAYSFLGFTHVVASLLVVATFASFGNGVLRPVITSRLTQAVGRHEQGTVLGLSQSLAGIAMTVAPPVGGFLIERRWLGAWGLTCAAVGALGLAVASMSMTAPAATASR